MLPRFTHCPNTVCRDFLIPWQINRRLIRRVLWHQLTCERLLENGLLKSSMTLETQTYNSLRLMYYGQQRFHLVHNSLLFLQRWKGHAKVFQLGSEHMLNQASSVEAINEPTEYLGFEHPKQVL